MKRVYLKTETENVEQGRAATALAEKHQYWQEHIEAGKQEGKNCSGGY
jgi:hypothetical protein